MHGDVCEIRSCYTILMNEKLFEYFKTQFNGRKCRKRINRVLVIELVRRSVMYSRRSTIGIQLSNRNRNYKKNDEILPEESCYT